MPFLNYVTFKYLHLNRLNIMEDRLAYYIYIYIIYTQKILSKYNKVQF